MDCTEILEEINSFLKQNYKMVPYGELVGAPWPYTYQGPMVYEEPEARLLQKAADAITEMAKVLAVLASQTKHLNNRTATD